MDRRLLILISILKFAEPWIVNTSYGSLRGMPIRSTDGQACYIFKGIPIAKPPVGERRFKLPEPPERWEGVRNATRYRTMRFWLLIALVCTACLSFVEMAAVKTPPMPAPKKPAAVVPMPKGGPAKKARRNYLSRLHHHNHRLPPSLKTNNFSPINLAYFLLDLHFYDQISHCTSATRTMRFWLLIALVCVLCLSFAEMAAVKKARKGTHTLVPKLPLPNKEAPKKTTNLQGGGPHTQTGAKKARRYWWPRRHPHHHHHDHPAGH